LLTGPVLRALLLVGAGDGCLPRQLLGRWIALLRYCG
jgi:hypothetical protein